MEGNFTDWLLAIGAKLDDNGYYSFDQGQVAALLVQEDGIDMTYDAIQHEWLPVTGVEPEFYEKARAAIQLAAQRIGWRRGYTFPMFQSAVKRDFPGIKCYGCPEFFIAQSELVAMHYWRFLQRWDIEQSDKYGKGQTFYEAFQDLAPIDSSLPGEQQ